MKCGVDMDSGYFLAIKQSESSPGKQKAADPDDLQPLTNNAD
ncbi:hypothetical protein LT85_1701 [Collimonas arenae]|uniref:Uncharacterized protein n=1 Tax=Collimonas arenae TaxID=279058 RepID=A0A0A1FB26_9BURK|nr:hypothetical protein LT85_1701 [Collimonas arenae]